MDLSLIATSMTPCRLQVASCLDGVNPLAVTLHGLHPAGQFGPSRLWTLFHSVV